MAAKVKFVWIDPSVNNHENKNYQRLFLQISPEFLFLSSTVGELPVLFVNNPGARFIIVSSARVLTELLNLLVAHGLQTRSRIICFTGAAAGFCTEQKAIHPNIFKVCTNVQSTVQAVTQSRDSWVSSVVPIVPPISSIPDWQATPILPHEFIAQYFQALQQEIPEVAQLATMSGGEKSDLVKYLSQQPFNPQQASALVHELATNQSFSISSSFDGVQTVKSSLEGNPARVVPSSPKFIKSVVKQMKSFNVNQAKASLIQYAHETGVSANSVNLSGGAQNPVWPNPSFIRAYSGNELYYQLNRDLRRFDSYYKKAMGKPLSAYEQQELPASWSPSVVENGWMPFINGCLTNYTQQNRKKTSQTVMGKKLRRGYAIPVASLPTYAADFPVNKVFYWPAFTSTSNKPAGFSGEVQITITPSPNTSGIDITSVSQFPGECEVLFPPFTWFIVKKQNLSSTHLRLELEEMNLFDYVALALQ